MDHREELKVLVELDRTGNMRRAAEALGISQSTLSECVNRLEIAYGAPLFERDRRGSRATVYGQVAVEAARRALQTIGEARREIELIKGSASGRLAIGAEPGAIEPFLTEAIARNLPRFPRLRYRVQALDSNALAQEVRDKRIDFFLGVRPDGPAGGLDLVEFGYLRSAPFVRRGHPLAKRSGLTLGAITQYPIVQGPGPRWLIRRIAAALRDELPDDEGRINAAVIVNDFGVVRALVRQTDAVGFASLAMLNGHVERELFVTLDMPASQRDLLQLPLLIGTLQQRVLPPAATSLIAELHTVVEELQTHPGRGFEPAGGR